MNNNVMSIHYQMADKRYDHLYLPSLIRAWVHESDTAVEDLVIPRRKGNDRSIFPADISPAELMIALGTNDDGTVRLMFGNSPYAAAGKIILLVALDNVEIKPCSSDINPNYATTITHREYFIDMTDPTQYIVSRGIHGRDERYTELVKKIMEDFNAMVREQIVQENLLDKAIATFNNTTTA